MGGYGFRLPALCLLTRHAGLIHPLTLRCEGTGHRFGSRRADFLYSDYLPITNLGFRFDLAGEDP